MWEFPSPLLPAPSSLCQKQKPAQESKLTESKDSLLINDSDIIDVVSVQMDIFNRSVFCSTQQTADYDEMVKLMTRATARLNLNWSGSKRETVEGHLDEWYLR